MLYNEGTLWSIMREHCGLLCGSIVVYYERAMCCIMREHCGLS